MSPETREHLIDFLRLGAGVTWLVLAVAVFHPPLLELSGQEDLAGVGEGLRDKVGLDDLLPEASERFINATSNPPGGRFFVEGVDRGILPAMVNISCREGQEVNLRVALDGYQAWEREVECPGEEVLNVEAVLQR